MTKIVCISDTHSQHNNMRMPDGDILIHAGDSTNTGTRSQLLDFVNWFGNQKHKHKILIFGNHDWGMDGNGKDYLSWCRRRGVPLTDLDDIRVEVERLISDLGIILLNRSGVEIEGIKFWGAPDNAKFGGWAFNRNNTQLTEIWKNIPDDTDILITHGPAYGILDRNLEGDMCGDVPLMKRLNTLPNLKYHICGHIHEDAGVVKVNNTVHINASMLDRYYKPNFNNPPRVFKYEP